MKNKIVIIGAGPAGLTTALFLAKAGIPHTVLEKSTFPRDKVCGESYDGKVFHTLKRLHDAWPAQLIRAGILTPLWEYRLNHLPHWEIPVSFSSDHTPRLQGRRSDLDQALLQHLLSYNLTEWRPNTQVISVERGQTDYRLNIHGQPNILAELVVYAGGGATTKLNSDVGIPKRKNGLIYSRIHLQVDNDQLPVQPINIRFLRNPIPACLVICPLPGGYYNIGLGIRKKDYIHLDGNLNDWLNRLVDEEIDRLPTGIFVHRMNKPSGAHVQLHHYSNRLSGLGWVVVGSAAVEVNPVTGMGVGNAMRSGELAAKAIIRAIANKENLFMAGYSSYASSLKRSLRSEIRFSRILTALQFHASWLGHTMPFIWKSRRIQRWLQQPDVVSNFLNPQHYWRK
ncbi:MAG: NAD(P)/FAD-dependent oxidoreductase [Saprospiraceae bacterium]|nr:NAD(P)/FAD-dependent oxidoreductase [Saprospiraceae bacterium]